MIEGLELTWRKNWSEPQLLIHAETKKYNRLLANQKSKNILLSSLIDAVSHETISDLQKVYDKIFLITEQDATNLPQNVLLHKLPQEYYGCYFTEQIPNDQYVIKKDFNCFLNRLDPIRQTWFYLLFDRGFLDRGYVSFNMSHDRLPDFAHLSKFEVFDLFHQDFLSGFDNIRQEIKDVVPFKNFIDTNDLFSIVLESKISVVVETYFERTDVKTFTEKTFRALQLPRPWLLFAATGCVNRLKSMGFDVYDDIVDHSYDQFDTSVSCVDRQEAILSQLPSLLDLKFTPGLVKRLTQGATHNRQLLQDWNSKWKNLCLSSVHDTFLKAQEN